MAGIVAGLALLLVLRIASQVNWTQMLQAMGLYGSGKSMAIPKVQPGHSFWVVLGAIGLVFLTGVIFPPLAWLLLLSGFLYLFIAEGLLSKLETQSKTLPGNGGSKNGG